MRVGPAPRLNVFAPAPDQAKICTNGVRCTNKKNGECAYAHSYDSLVVRYVHERFKTQVCNSYPQCMRSDDDCSYIHGAEVEKQLLSECERCVILLRKGLPVAKLCRIPRNAQYLCECFQQERSWWAR